MTPRTAADYWKAIDEAWAAHAAAHPDDPGGGKVAQDLASEAVQAGVWKDFVDVGDGVKVRLQDLIAPLRIRSGGLTDQNRRRYEETVVAGMARYRKRWDRA